MFAISWQITLYTVGCFFIIGLIFLCIFRTIENKEENILKNKS